METMSNLEVDDSIDYSTIFDDVKINEHSLIKETASHIFGPAKLRVRLEHEKLTGVEWMTLEQTYNNISGGKMGKCALFNNQGFSDNVETAFLKVLSFGMVCKYTILKHVLQVSETFTVHEWEILCNTYIPHIFDDEEWEKENVKTFRFGDKSLSFTGPKTVADAFYDTALKWQILPITKPRHRLTGGLKQFTCPRHARSYVSAARKKVFFLLPREHRIRFCLEQLFGDHFDLQKCLDNIHCQSPNDVHIELVTLHEGYLENSLEQQVQEQGVDTGIGPRKKPRLQETDQEERRVVHASISREGSRQGSKTEAYLKERAEQAEHELDRLREELQKLKLKQEASQHIGLKLQQETAQAASQQHIGVKIEDDSDSDDSDSDDSVTSEERNRFFRQMDEEQEKQEKERDQREIEQYGREGHELRKRRRLSQYDSSYALTFVEMRNTYRTMRDKERVIQIELRVWLPVFLFACYFAVMEYGAAYIHEEEYLYTLDDDRLQGSNDFIIYIFIFLCSLIMLAFFAFGTPTACDWFYGVLIMPATRLCFASNQGYASMIAIILLCSQNRKPLLLVEFLGVICFIIFAPLANRFVFAGRLILSLVFYQNRLINHIDHRAPTIFLSPWRETILTLFFLIHSVLEKLELFFCACGGYQ
jgi:hypothetical protein